MEKTETPQSAEVVDYEAKQLVKEHLSLTALRETAKEQLYASNTPEDRKVTGNLYGEVAKLNKEHITSASEFAHDNLPELIKQATQEATQAGHSIDHYEEQPKSPASVNLEALLEGTIRRYESGDSIPSFIITRLQVAKAFCEENGIDITHIQTEDVMRIRELPEWQAAED